jgi:hypothetical protein
VGINVTLIGYGTINYSCKHILKIEVVGHVVYMGLEHGMVIIGSCINLQGIMVNIPRA